MKRINKKLLFCLFLVAINLPLSAQKADKRTKKEILKSERSFQELSYPKAIQRYRKVLDQEPGNREAILRIAYSYQQMNDYSAAAQWYGQASEKGYLTGKTDQLNYARVLESLGRYSEAEIYLGKHGSHGVMAELVSNKIQGISSLERFYLDSAAYDISNAEFNTPYSDFGPAFMEDGIVIASARPSKGILKPRYSWDNSNFLDMLYVEEGHEPKKMSRKINSRYHEGPATFYDNSTQVIFTRNNYRKGDAGESQEGINKLKLYHSYKKNTGSEWSVPVELPFNSNEYSVGHPTITEDGKTLYFASDMPGGEGGTDLYRSFMKDGSWTAPENLGPEINTPGDEMFPFIHKEGILYFASNGKPGLGGLDIYRTSLNSGGEVENLGYPINTAQDDFGLIMGEHGLSGYLSSNRKNGKGHDDIYFFERIIYPLKGILVDASSGAELKGKLQVTDQQNGSLFTTTDLEGKVYLNVPRGRQVSFTGSAKGYRQAVINLDTRTIKNANGVYLVEIPLQPVPTTPPVHVIAVENNQAIEQLYSLENNQPREFTGTLEELEKQLATEDKRLGTMFIYRNIYYNFDQSAIRPDAAAELDRLADLLAEYPELNIVLSAHTDVRGSQGYNSKLASRRAAQAAAYLQKKGISATRVSVESYGENRPVTSCGTNCHGEQHQANRRTEIKLSTEK